MRTKMFICTIKYLSLIHISKCFQHTHSAVISGTSANTDNEVADTPADCMKAVSYTHLDVYKRQVPLSTDGTTPSPHVQVLISQPSAFRCFLAALRFSLPDRKMCIRDSHGIDHYKHHDNRKNNFLKLVFRHKKSSLDSMNNIN